MRPWVPSGRVWRNPPSTRRAVTASTRRPGKPLMSLSAPTAASGLPGTTAGSRAGAPMLGVAAAGRTGALLQAHPPDCRRHGCRLGDQGGRHLAELLEHAPANVSEWTPPTSHRRVGAPVATTAAVRVQTVGKQPILAASKLRDRWELALDSFHHSASKQSKERGGSAGRRDSGRGPRKQGPDVPGRTT